MRRRGKEKRKIDESGAAGDPTEVLDKGVNVRVVKKKKVKSKRGGKRW